MNITQMLLAKSTITNGGYATEEQVQELSEDVATVTALAKQCNLALGVDNYSSLVTILNGSNSTAYNVGQSFLIRTLNVPDLWVYEVMETSTPYTYTTDQAITTALESTGYIQIGYYKIAMLETLKQDLTNYVSTDEMVQMTQAEYEALETKDTSTYYFITD